jgi:hypothetical protein
MSETQEQQNDSDWDFEINLSGVTAPTGKGSALPEGYYRGVIRDMYSKADKPGRAIISLQVSEGPHVGTTRTDGLNKPKNSEDKVRYYWRGLAESAGYTPAELDAGAIKLGPKSFIGRGVHFRFTPKSETKEYEQIDYLAPAEWASQAKAFGAVNGVESGSVESGSVEAGTVVASESGGAAGTVSKSSLLDQLGV